MRKGRIAAILIFVFIVWSKLFGQAPETPTYWVETTKHDNIRVIHLSVFVSPRSDEWKSDSRHSKFGRELDKVADLKDFQLSAKEITLVSTSEKPSERSWEILIKKVLAKFAINKRIPSLVEVTAERAQSTHRVH